MEVIKVRVYYQGPQGINIVNLAAACPTGERLDKFKKVTAAGLETHWSLVANRWRHFRQSHHLLVRAASRDAARGRHRRPLRRADGHQREGLGRVPDVRTGLHAQWHGLLRRPGDAGGLA